MMRVRWAVVVAVLACAGGLWAKGAKSPLEARAAQSLQVQWGEVLYQKFVATENPALFKDPRRSGEILTLACQAEVRDPNLILGIGRDWVITQMTDAQGRTIAVPAPGRSRLGRYESLRYSRRQLPPPPVPRWRIILARLLRRPPPARGPAPMVYELQPYRTSIALHDVVLSEAGGELASIKGYFHVLVAESLENIDVPFEPNDAWVRLAPGVDIRVREAVWTQDFHRYWIELSPLGRDAVRRTVTIGAPLPSRLVVAQQELGADGKPLPFGSYPELLLRPIREHEANRGGERIAAFRFVIAINPAELQIPFEFTHVPLPDPNQ